MGGRCTEDMAGSRRRGGRAGRQGVFLVEDHPAMRRALRRLVEGEGDLVVLAEAASAEDALELLPKLQPDLVMVDLSLPRMSGLDLIKILQRSRPELRCVVVTGHTDPLYRAAAEAAGAARFAVKDDPGGVLAAIRSVLRSGGDAA